MSRITSHIAIGHSHSFNSAHFHIRNSSIRNKTPIFACSEWSAQEYNLFYSVVRRHCPDYFLCNRIFISAYMASNSRVSKAFWIRPIQARSCDFPPIAPGRLNYPHRPSAPLCIVCRVTADDAALTPSSGHPVHSVFRYGNRLPLRRLLDLGLLFAIHVY